MLSCHTLSVKGQNSSYDAFKFIRTEIVDLQLAPAVVACDFDLCTEALPKAILEILNIGIPPLSGSTLNNPVLPANQGTHMTLGLPHGHPLLHYSFCCSALDSTVLDPKKRTRMPRRQSTASYHSLNVGFKMQ